MKHFILATAGHVDHGKSSLVKALTGTDPDRLPEEKVRGITIELGFAELRLPDAIIGIVDVPGHEDFVKNMVAGVGSIDLALLVVAADDGWMPQTEEHLQILTYLGVKRAIIALTKADLGDYDVCEQLIGTPFEDAPVVRTSITSGHGIEEFKEQLARECVALIPTADIGKPRLAVDRAFTLRGIGTVVTGTLTGGKLRRGHSIVVQPAGTPARIRAIQSHKREREEVGPGTRTALNLPDLEIGERGVRRGDVVVLPSSGETTTCIDALISRSSRLPADTRPLKHGTTVRVHHGTVNSAARVFFSESELLRTGESAVAQLRFDLPVFIFAGDRFVIRDSAEQQTLAGGVVLDADASLKNFRTPAQLEFLAARAHAPECVETFVRTQLRRDHFACRSELLVKSRFSAREISAAIAKSDSVARGELVFDAQWWSEICEQTKAMIDREHGEHPNHIGLEISRLRLQISSDKVFETVLEELCDNGFTRVGDKIRRANHRPVLPPSLQDAGERVRAALATKPFDPPSRKELAQDAVSQEALRCLCDTGEVIEINHELVLSREQLTKAHDAIVNFIDRNGSATVSDLRQVLGSSRRVMVPLLEYFDREGLTRRVQDKRVLRSPS